MKYDYTVYKENSSSVFKEACNKIEAYYPNIDKKKLLIDVDGTTIQEYIINDQAVVVYDDYEIGAVFVKSEIDLNHIFQTTY